MVVAITATVAPIPIAVGVAIAVAMAPMVPVVPMMTVAVPIVVVTPIADLESLSRSDVGRRGGGGRDWRGLHRGTEASDRERHRERRNASQFSKHADDLPFDG